MTTLSYEDITVNQLSNDPETSPASLNQSNNCQSPSVARIDGSNISNHLGHALTKRLQSTARQLLSCISSQTYTVTNTEYLQGVIHSLRKKQLKSINGQVGQSSLGNFPMRNRRRVAKVVPKLSGLRRRLQINRTRRRLKNRFSRQIHKCYSISFLFFYILLSFSSLHIDNCLGV